jgi:ribonuclease HI
MRGKEEKPHVEIFCDGACSGNPGVGGYGAILRYGKKETEISDCDPLTTNNRMEMLAAIAALEKLKKPCRVTIITDSNYLVKGMTEWIKMWVKNKWKSSQKKEVLNRDLWERLLEASKKHDIQWIWIKGHSGHPENERCHRMAQEAIKRCKMINEKA